MITYSHKQFRWTRSHDNSSLQELSRKPKERHEQERQDNFIDGFAQNEPGIVSITENDTVEKKKPLNFLDGL